jgi:hypothetical protein
MHGHACVAAVTFRDLAAAGTNKGWRKTTAIKKDQRLTALLKIIPDGGYDRFTQPIA